jgi:hypothetical protein
MTSAAIMQPTYLPWLGYFALMDRVDLFIFLDTVQFDRRSWQQRNRIKGANGEQTLTIPVHKKGLRDQTIAEVGIVNDGVFPDKHIRAIELAYARAPHFERYANDLFEIFRSGHTLLADLSIALIEWLTDTLGIVTRCVRSNTLDAQGNKADLLADICGRLDVDSYVSSPGSRGYLDASDAFDQASIPVTYAEYEHPVFPQLHGPFIPQMSVIDLLFNVGPDSLDVIRSGLR